jgi:hypothetical protein
VSGNHRGWWSHREYRGAGHERAAAFRKFWSQNITITTRLGDAITPPLLLKTVTAGKLKPKQLITHHFTLDDIASAYDTIGNAGREHALNVIRTNEWGGAKASFPRHLWGEHPMANGSGRKLFSPYETPAFFPTPNPKDIR